MVVGYNDLQEIKYDNLSNKHKTIFAPNGLKIVEVWVKSGCYMSGDGPGYGRYFENPHDCDSSTAIPTKTPTTQSPIQFPTASPSLSPTAAQTGGEVCPPQKSPRNDPCDKFGRSESECKKLDIKLKDEKCIFFKERRYWLNGHGDWNDPARKTVQLRKSCPSDAVNGAFASQIRRNVNGSWTPWKFQPLGCQAEWDSRQLISEESCSTRARWNTWIIGNGDLGECGVANADNNKCYAAQRFNFCGLLNATDCAAAIHCSWQDEFCVERDDLHSQLHNAEGIVRKDGFYFQDSKQLAGPALSTENPTLVLPEVGNFNNGFIRLFGFKGCNNEFDLSAAAGSTDVQIRCDQNVLFSTIGTVSTAQMDQSELHEFVFPVADNANCEVRLDYTGTGEVFWPSIRLGGFAPI